MILSVLTIVCSCVNMPVSATENVVENTEITVSNSPELWEKFLKYDLCILDYDSLTDKDKNLCKFIFETELNSPDTITCERVRRTLAGYDVGERVTLDAVKQTPCIEDRALYCHNGEVSLVDCIDAVPDISYIDYDCNKCEYWIDASGTEKIVLMMNGTIKYIVIIFVLILHT